MDKDRLRQWIAAALVVLGAGVFATRVALNGRGVWTRVATSGMAPTIPFGAHVISNPWAYRSAAPQRGDIVLDRPTRDARVLYMRRVIGLPGETIEIHAKVVRINGKNLDEPYVVHTDPTVYPRNRRLPQPYRSRDEFGPLSIPAGRYFLMGDNRDRSHDSRYTGCVRRDLIVAKVIRVVG
jgi:signal peptidase I